jgi:hypothetical protein
MKVSELIAQLQKLPQDNEVIVSSDAEGNSFHQLDEVGLGEYDVSGYYVEQLEVENGGTACVVLWP